MLQSLNYDACVYQAYVQHMLDYTESEGGCTTPWLVNANKVCKKSENMKATCEIFFERHGVDCKLDCNNLRLVLGSTAYGAQRRGKKTK